MASIAGIGVGAGLGYLIAHERAPARAGDGPGESRPAGAAELALLAPLGPGSALADFEVIEIQAVSAGTLGVVCERGDTRVTLEVSPAKAGPTPPAMAGPYAIFYATGRQRRRMASGWRWRSRRSSSVTRRRRSPRG